MKIAVSDGCDVLLLKFVSLAARFPLHPHPGHNFFLNFVTFYDITDLRLLPNGLSPVLRLPEPSRSQTHQSRSHLALQGSSLVNAGPIIPGLWKVQFSSFEVVVHFIAKNGHSVLNAFVYFCVLQSHHYCAEHFAELHGLFVRI